MVWFLISAVFERIVINTSSSHEGTFFWKTEKPPSYNNYVYFDFEHKLLPKKIKILSKQLVCIAGNNLTIDDDFIVCDDKAYPIKRMESTGSGKLLPQFYYNGFVPDGQAIVYGTHPESFDSRYWGFIEYNQLGVMKLVF